MDKPSKEDVAHKMQSIQIPFVANNGQVDKQVKFYAKTFGGAVFVTQNGEIVYSLPGNGSESGVESLESDGRRQRSESNPKSAIQNLKSGVAIKETLVGGRVHEITGNEKAVTKVNYFRGSDPSEWKSNISTYDSVTFEEVYKGIDLKLKAYGNNIEKLFYVSPNTNPETIKIKLSGARPLKVDEEGQLEAETDLGRVKFTKPVAYQEINGKRVDVSVEYRIQKSELNPKSTIRNLSSASIGDPQLEYGFKVASYDKTKDLIIDPLLASTYLGGSSYDIGSSLALDKSGNVYVTGWNYSTDFPTTTGAYDNYYNGNVSDSDGTDVFISKLSGDLTNLIASTYLGGSACYNVASSIVIDSNRNIYVAGSTDSSDFPTTTGAYDTSYNSEGQYGNGFVSKLNSDLSNLLASTYLGGSGDWNYIKSMTIDSDGNVYVAGSTNSSDFPTTTGAYDTSFNGQNSTGYSRYDIFVSKLDENLTTLHASTYLGGTGYDNGGYITIDSSGSIYITGYTSSSNFPTTTGAYDTSFNGNVSYSDVFVSKMNNSLSSLLASTFLGGTSSDQCSSIAIDSDGNVYVAGLTSSSNFPTTTGAYDTSYNDVFISKFNGNLANLLASTYFGGSDWLTLPIIRSSGNVLYVVGQTSSSNFPTTTGAYDNSYNGSSDAFVSKFDTNLSANTGTVVTPTPTPTASPTLPPLPSPSVSITPTPIPSPTPSSSNIFGFVYDSEEEPIQDGTITIKGDNYSGSTSTDEYGYYELKNLSSGDYTLTYSKEGYQTQTQDVTLGENENQDLGILTLESVEKGSITGSVVDFRGYEIDSATIRMKGLHTGYSKTISSDTDGYFEFTDLETDTYILTAKKSGFKQGRRTVKLSEGEAREIELKMKRKRTKSVQSQF